MSLQEILVPDIGGFENVEVIEVLVAEGDAVEVEDSLITLETDKATMEVPAPAAGVVKSIKLAVGDTVSEGGLILELGPVSSKPEVEPEPVVEELAESQPPKPTTAVTELKTIVVPDIGDFDEVEVIEVLVAPGDAVHAEDSIITLESDKASMEIPSPESGVINDVSLKVGDKVKRGDVILSLQLGTEVAEPEPVEAAVEPQSDAPVSQPERVSPTAQFDEVAFSKAHASPSVRKFARELGVDLGRVKGSGRKGRIVQDDVQAFVKQVMDVTKSGASLAEAGAGLPMMPEVDFSKWGEVDIQPLTKINRLTGKNLHRAWLNVPHVTSFDEADITELEAFRKSLVDEFRDQGIKVTLTTFLVKAMAAAVKEYPRFNSSLDASGENLVLKRYINIGIAVDTPGGLVVPVIKDADQKSLLQLASEMSELSKKARNKQLKPTDMQGGSITISSLGGIGGTQFTPIVNAPEVAILGVPRASMKPVWNGEAFEPRLIMPMALSYDHRVIDGALGVRFTSYLGRLLNDPRRMLL